LGEKVIPVKEEGIDGLVKKIKGLVVVIVNDLLFEEFPKSLNKGLECREA
jgi:hypothetical protein